ncbi:DNA polymerase V, subunit D [Magnetospirillum sp. LM-5]|uniref:LexA family protein n=1 Tax=Magnetospirillum sp. LM-5 TaxID=2681466 RepID=UPI0013834A48|nr:translesion error-prone DNA polymerase V autoproteolytic subunit [Magnetospirillum sp. LM-5]CAA7619909.1 DNA polymerase V, subunit D [Magnetospirillum sp. LM-5]
MFRIIPIFEPVAPLSLPCFETVPAGFPSPAQDHAEKRLDVYELLVRRPASTFFCRADGPSMQGAGINSGDLLVVDRAIEPQAGDVVVATLDGGLTVKRLVHQHGCWLLAPENPEFPPLVINPEEGVMIWGVVTYSITGHCPR